MNAAVTDAERYLINKLTPVMKPIGTVISTVIINNIRLLQNDKMKPEFRTFSYDDAEYMLYHLGEIYVNFITDARFISFCARLVNMGKNTEKIPSVSNIEEPVTIDLTNLNIDMIDSFMWHLADGYSNYRIYDNVLLEHMIVAGGEDRDQVTYAVSNFAYLLKGLTLLDGENMQLFRSYVDDTEIKLANMKHILARIPKGRHLGRLNGLI